MRGWGTGKRQNTGNAERISLGFSQLINHLEFERTLAVGGGGEF